MGQNSFFGCAMRLQKSIEILWLLRGELQFFISEKSLIALLKYLISTLLNSLQMYDSFLEY